MDEVALSLISGLSAAGLSAAVALYFVKRWIHRTETQLDSVEGRLRHHHMEIRAMIDTLEKDLDGADGKIKDSLDSLRSDLPDRYIQRLEFEQRHQQLRELIQAQNVFAEKMDMKLDRLITRTARLAKSTDENE